MHPDRRGEIYLPALWEIERVLRLEPGVVLPASWGSSSSSAADYLWGAMERDQELFLNVIDCFLSRFASQDDEGQLERYLSEGGSAWTLMPFDAGPRGNRDMRHYLSRRVSKPVAETASKTLASPHRAAQHLALAWRHVYGRQPDASAGYRESVRAVEAAYDSIVRPKDSQATLGKIIADLKESPGLFTLVLNSTVVQGTDVTRLMQQLLWKAQLDRHGTSNEEIPLSVTPTEAEAALHLAATLVHWGIGGLFKRLG